MNDNEYQIEELLWRRLDGELSPSETERLDALMARVPDARDLESRIADLSRELASVEEEIPPAEIRRNLAEVLSRRPIPAQSNAEVVETGTSWFPRITWSAPVWRFAAAATLVIVAFVGYRLATGGDNHSGDSSQYVGTISPFAAARGRAAEIPLGDDRGAVDVSRHENTVVMSLRLRSEATVDLRVNAPGQSLRWVRVEPTSIGAPKATESGVSWAVSGPGGFVLVLEPEVMDGLLEVSVHGSTGVLGESKMQIGDLPE